MLSEQDQTTVDYVEAIAVLMVKHNLLSVEASDGQFKITRSEKEPYYKALGEQAASLGATPPTDEELLMNPMAGLEKVNG